MANDPQRCTTPEFRANHVYVFEPRQPREGDSNKEPQYGMEAIFPLGATLDAMKKAAQAALDANFGEKMKNPEFVKTLRSPFRRQDDKIKIDEVTGKETLPDGYTKGGVFVRLKNRTRFGVVSTKPDPANPAKCAFITDPADVYAGMYGVAVVRANAYPRKGKPDLGNRGVSFYIEAFQKTRDGEPISGRVKAEEAFEPIATEETTDARDDIFGV